MKKGKLAIVVLYSLLQQEAAENSFVSKVVAVCSGCCVSSWKTNASTRVNPPWILSLLHQHDEGGPNCCHSVAMQWETIQAAIAPAAIIDSKESILSRGDHEGAANRWLVFHCCSGIDAMIPSFDKR